jgi:hypothetical protein
MAFYYRHAGMTMRSSRDQKMAYIFLTTFDIFKINSLSVEAIDPV